MTDEEFEKWFALRDSDRFILEKLAYWSTEIITQSGGEYPIDNLNDIRALVKRELCQQMTGKI